MRLPILATIAASACLLTAASAVAQTGSHEGHATPAAKPPAAVAEMASVKAYMAANDRMHKEMTIKFSGNADVDFVRGMIPHHQGAVDMAKVVLEHGKDRSIRRLARNVIRTQNAEIAMMKAWLAKNDKK